MSPAPDTPRSADPAPLPSAPGAGPSAGAAAPAAEDGPPATTNGVVFWPLAVATLLADVVTKAMAVYTLHPRGLPHDVIGDTVRFTLVYNPGAAFGLHVGPHSRWIFLALTCVVLAALWRLYRWTPDRDNARTAAIALVCAGAVGNAIDRLRSADGVVDFIDIGLGAARWPTFNIADVAVSVGAFTLAWVLWGEEGAENAPSGARSGAVPRAEPAEGA